MPNTKVNKNEVQDKILQEKVTEVRLKEIETRLNQLGLKSPGYLRGMSDVDMKDIDIRFLE